MRRVGAIWFAVLMPSCSLLFDARDIAEKFDGGVPIPTGPIVRFEVAPQSIALGETALLVWETDGADEVWIEEDGDRISDDASGELLVEPSSTTTYRIDAGGEEREITVFVDEEVPPEIVRFSLYPNVLIAPQIDASWRVTHGSVSLIGGESIVDDLPSVGSVETTVPVPSDLTLFVYAAGSSERTRRAFAVEPLAEQPHQLDGFAVELDATNADQSLLWNVPEVVSLLPTVVDAGGDCVDASIVATVLTSGQELGRFNACDRKVLTTSGLILFEVSLYDLPPRAFFVPEERKVACGNGITESPEECDDYDLFSGDGCSSACTTEPGVHLVSSPSAISPPDLSPAGARSLEFSTYDDGSLGWAAVGAPFPIELYGRSYAGVIVHRNGAITFDLDTTERRPRIPSRLPHPSVGHDIVIALASRYEGAIEDYDALSWEQADRLVIDLSSDDARVQVHFLQGGQIEIRFGEIGSSGAVVASGIQERTGHLGSNSFICADACVLDDAPPNRGTLFR